MSETLEKIAMRVGVSKSTASRALRNDRLVHPDTRSRILAEAARAGYARPAKGKKEPSSRETRVLFLLPRHALNYANYDFQLYLRGVTRAADELNWLLSVEEISNGKDGGRSRRSSLPREINSGNANAVIVAYNHNPEDVAAIARLRPVVSIQWDHGGAATDLVSAFNYQGVAAIVRHFTQSGHQRLAWVGSDYPASFFVDRQAGFLKGCLEQGIEVRGENIFASAGELERDANLHKLLKRGITGVLCANDVVALHVAALAQKQGLRIPEDFGIAGFDAGEKRLPGGQVLTSYDPGLAELGRSAVFVAMQRLKDPGAPRLIHLREGRLQEGASTVPD